MFYFFHTCEIDGRPKLRALPGQTFPSGGPVDTELNVQADSIMRSSYPIGTVFGSDHLSLRNCSSAPFYGTGDIYPLGLEFESYIISAHIPPAPMVQAYAAYMRRMDNESNNQSNTSTDNTMAYIYRKVKITRTSDNSLVQFGAFIQDTIGDIWYATRENNITIPAHSRTAGIPGLSIPGATITYEHLDNPATSLATICSMIARRVCLSFLSQYNITFIDAAVEITEGSTLELPTNQAAEFVAQPQAAPATGSSVDEEINIKSGYSLNEIYSGFSSYHSNQRNHRFNTPLRADKPYRIGIELELYAKTREAYNAIVNTRTNWFQCESDGSLNQASYPIEMKTIPLKACDATSVNFWEAPMNRLRQLANSKNFTSTGLHVHIGKEILSNTDAERKLTVAKLYMFYTYLVEDNADAHRKNVVICGREQGYHSEIGITKCTLGDIVKDMGIENFHKLSAANKTKLINEFYHSCGSARWDLNLNNLNSYGTIEFRKGKGIISKMRLAAICTWWEQMVLYCKNTDWHELSFDAFFNSVTSRFPAVAYYFQQDEEA